jgi:hypothetical protein
MLLSILFTILAGQQPATPPAMPSAIPAWAALDALPAESLVICELHLPVWDQLRKPTHAHGVLRDLDLLTRTLKERFSGRRTVTVHRLTADETVPLSLRDALVGSRIALVWTASSLRLGGAPLLLVEPTRPGMVQFPLERILLDEWGIAPIKLGGAWMTVLAASEHRSGADAYLKKLAETVAEPGARLGEDGRWTTLRTALSGPNDITRAHFLTWNWNDRVIGDFIQVVGEVLLGQGVRPFEEKPSVMSIAHGAADLIELLGGSQGISWTTAVDGADIVDQVFVPRAESKLEGSFLVPLGKPESALDQLAQVKCMHPSTATVLGVDFTHYSRFLDTFFAEARERSKGQNRLDDYPFGQALAAISFMMAELHPQVQSWKPIGLDEVAAFGGLRVRIEDRLAFEQAFDRLPYEFENVGKSLLAYLSLGGISFELAKNEIVLMRNRRFDQPLALAGEQPGFAQARAEIEAFLNGREALAIQFAPQARDEIWLTRDGGLYLLLEQLCGKNFGAPELPESRRAHLQPIWSVAWREEDGLHWQARSTFGWAISSFLSESSRAAWRAQQWLDRARSDELDEAEF